MKKIGLSFIFLLLISMLVGGCTNQNTEFTLKLIPPQNLQLPLKGTWKIVSSISEKTANTGELTQKWIGKKIYFTDKHVLLGEYLLVNPRLQIKKVVAETYLFYRHQVFPENFHFQNPELEVFTLSDNHLFFCELLREKEDRLWLNLFNNCYLVHKIADEVDETVFSALVNAGDTTESINLGNLMEPAGNQTGVLLGLRAPAREREQADNATAQYRTIWLALADQKLAPPLETKTIVFPRKSGFYRLQVLKNIEKRQEEDILSVDPLLKQQEKEKGKAEEKEWRKKKEENVLTRSAADLSQSEKEGEEEKDTRTRPPAEKYIARKILFIGNDYVSVEETRQQTMSAHQGSTDGESSLHLYAIDSLPGLKAISLSDLVGPHAVTAMEHGRQKLWKQLGLKQTGQLDENNFGLTRKMGYWIFKSKVNYQKNGLHKTADYNITVIPPNDVISFNKLHLPWTRVKNAVPSARDVFTSPHKDLALVVTNNEIIVYGTFQENLVEPPLARVPLKQGEEIIMAEWALGHYVEDWTLTFQTYLAQEK
jgi:hypothetical protein